MDIERFQTLVRTHRSASHVLFELIENAARNQTLQKKDYHVFAVNIAARTMLSLPEIHACCIQASLDLDPLRTAYSVMTGAEEGGAGKPKEVHSVLMMNALNYHGMRVFGLEPINLKYLMSLTRLIHTCRHYKTLFLLDNEFPGLSENATMLTLADTDEWSDIYKRMAEIAGITLPSDNLSTAAEFEWLEKVATSALFETGVIQATLDYCLAQIAVLKKMKTGYLQGVGFAHESLADGMIDKMFRILYAQVGRYSSENEFLENVYPYFSAHGNYLDVYKGMSDYAEGVEVTHAQREMDKLKQLDHFALETAWLGANDFADRNVKIWDGILQVITPSQKLDYCHE